MKFCESFSSRVAMHLNCLSRQQKRSTRVRRDADQRPVESDDSCVMDSPHVRLGFKEIDECIGIVALVSDDALYLTPLDEGWRCGHVPSGQTQSQGLPRLQPSHECWCSALSVTSDGLIASFLGRRLRVNGLAQWASRRTIAPDRRRA